MRLLVLKTFLKEPSLITHNTFFFMIVLFVDFEVVKIPSLMAETLIMTILGCAIATIDFCV